MRITATLLMGCVLIAAHGFAAPLEAEVVDDEVRITVNGALFTAYKFNEELKYPYFWPVNGPLSGESVTTETSEPFPHHRSLFFGCDYVNGANFWQEENDVGQIVSEGPQVTQASGERVVFTDTSLWQVPGEEPIIRDHRRIAVTAPSDTLRIIDFEITLEPLVDIVIERTNHSLFSARMVPELSVNEGGTLVNAEGGENEEGTFGISSNWASYYGTRDGVTEGLAIFQHPDNRWHPAPWFTRNYGFFSPTPMFWLENDRLELPLGTDLTLKYRVVVHAGDADEAGLATLYSQYEG